jgi:hypothetical protein
MTDELQTREQMLRSLDRRTANSSGLKVKDEAVERAAKYMARDHALSGNRSMEAVAEHIRDHWRRYEREARAILEAAALSPAEAGVEGDAKPVAEALADLFAKLKKCPRTDRGFHWQARDWQQRENLDVYGEWASTLYWVIENQDALISAIAALTHPSLLEECRKVLSETADALASRLTVEEKAATIRKPYEHLLSVYDRARALLTKLETAR